MRDPPTPTDETLLTRFAAAPIRGDEQRRALAELAARYEAPLLGLATGLLNGRADLARDAVQESWLRVIRSARTGGGFAERSAVKTWLYRIVINRCHDLRREHALSPDPAAALPRQSSPDHALANGELAAHVRAAVARLPADRRLILLLCYHRGMTHPQASDILGIPVGTLKSRLNAALAELRTTLSPEVRS